MLSAISESTFEEKGLGLLLGGCIGDSIGSFIQSSTSCSIKPRDIDLALSLTAQITSNSEIALAALHGYTDEYYNFDQQIANIAIRYKRWHYNNNSIIPSLSVGDGILSGPLLVTKYKEAASKHSQSNRALIRYGPLALATLSLNPDNLLKFIQSETTLTHQDNLIAYINYALTLIIREIFISQTLEPREALLRVRQYLSSQNIEPEGCNINQIVFNIDYVLKFNSPNDLPKGDNNNQCYVMIAFVYALFIFVQKYSFEESMRIILQQGGDTATNCCIAGYLVGALDSSSKFFRIQAKKIMDLPNLANNRPKEFIPKYNLNRLLKKLKHHLFENDAVWYVNLSSHKPLSFDFETNEWAKYNKSASIEREYLSGKHKYSFVVYGDLPIQYTLCFKCGIQYETCNPLSARAIQRHSRKTFLFSSNRDNLLVCDDCNILSVGLNIE